MKKQNRHWFSNFQYMEQPLVYDGVQYWTTENFYQAMKTTDKRLRAYIAKMKPHEAKKFCGRGNPDFKLRPDWNNIRLKVMEYALRKKVQLDWRFQQKLLMLNEPLVQTNYWHDNFYGECQCKKCQNVVKRNHLGKILEKIRREIKNYEQTKVFAMNNR